MEIKLPYCGSGPVLPVTVSLNCFRTKVKRIRKTKEDKEHRVAEEVKQDPAPEEDQETAGANLKGIRN